MKIKEVIEQTKLTDRAIRLYIDSGLVAPSIEENYSGRKNIDFSADDVERLNNIALLRKAGFSISDIKEIIESKEKAQTVVERFIEETENNIQHETEILSKLKNISRGNGITMKTICETLSATVSKNEVPKEDMHLNLWERFEQNSYKTVGIFGLLVTAAVFILTVVYWTTEYKHTTFTDGWLSWIAFVYSGWGIIAVLSVILLCLNRNKSVKRKRKGRRILSCIITVSIIVIGCFSSVFSFLSQLSPPVYSYTTNLSDYLELDDWVEDSYGDEIREFFPDKIPESALKNSNELYEATPYTTRYFYRHTYDLDQTVEIVAEWSLPLNEYNEVKNKNISKRKSTEQKGEWVCVYLTEDTITENGTVYTRQDEYIFAYNDKNNKVRYIASIITGTSKPYYITLDW